MTLALTLLFTLNLCRRLQRAWRRKATTDSDWQSLRLFRELFQVATSAGAAFGHETVTLLVEPPHFSR